MEDIKTDCKQDTNTMHTHAKPLPERRALSLIYFDKKEGFKVSDEASTFLK